MSRIVILNGSPRAGGNTDRLVEAFVSGLPEGSESEVIRASGMDIHPCVGCNLCRTNGNICRWDDDMGQVYTRLAQADVIVIASPTYYFGISAQLKALVDRLHNPVRNSFKVRRLVLLAVATGTDRSVFDAMVKAYQLTLDYFHLEDAGTVLVGGVCEKGDIEGREELQKARKLASTIS